MATKKKVAKTSEWPTVNKGTHLTVYTNEDGTTKLEWDDEALLNEVRNARPDLFCPIQRACLRGSCP